MANNKFFKPKRHEGYSAEHSPEWNVVHGRNRGLSYLTIGKELEALATVQKHNSPPAHKVFKRAAAIAYKKHDEGLK